MRAGWLVVALLCLTACIRRNPGYCGDEKIFKCGVGQHCDPDRGVCVDGQEAVDMDRQCTVSRDCPEDRPLCDGETRTCRPCLTGEDSQCGERLGAAARCLSPRCVQCAPPGEASVETSECEPRQPGRASLAPVCDQQKLLCRACSLHRECESGVCAKDGLSDAYGIPKGGCVPPEQVMVVDPSLCSDAGPVFCTPKQAIDRMGLSRRYVVFRKSALESDFSEIEVGNFGNQGMELFLIGPLADGPPIAAPALPRVNIGAPDRRGFIINRKSRVTIEGFFIHRGRIGVQCFGDGPGTDTQVRVLRSLLADNKTGVLIQDDCHLEMAETWVGRGPDQGAFAGVPANGLSVEVRLADFDIRNSVFVDNGDVRLDLFGGLHISPGLGGGVNGKRVSSIVNSTFYGHLAWVTLDGNRYTTLVCDTAVGSRLAVLNTLFFQDPTVPPFDRYITPNCGAQLHRLGSDDATLTANMSVVVPRGQPPGFKEAAKRDLHLVKLEGGGTDLQRQLQSGGATSITVGTTKIAAPEVDMDGKARPTATGHVAIGAYEP